MTIPARRNEAIETKAKGCKVAALGKLDRLPSKDLGLASPSSNACAANVVAFRDPFGRPLGLPECPGLNRVSPKTALATAPFLFLPGCSMHQGSSEWTNRNNCTLCNRRFPLVLGDRRGSRNEMREQDQMFCPRCAAPLLSVLDILDTVHEKTVRLLRFQCGEIIWSD